MIRQLYLIESELRKKIHDLPVEAYLRELLTVLPGTTDPEVIASLTPAPIAAARRNKPASEDAA